MKKISYATFTAFFIAIFVFTSALALILNGGFETGDFTSWTKSAFINNGFSAAPGSGGNDLSLIVGSVGGGPLALSDPHSGGNLLYPAYGDFSARINSDASYTGGGYAKNANVISQTINAVLDPNDNLAHVRFVYSAVMVEPLTNAHTSEQKPYFRVKVINVTTGNKVIYDFSSYVGEPGKNWQTGAAFSVDEDWKYINWQYVDIASSAENPISAGNSIIIEITAAGCSLGGHPGYVYVDEISDGDVGGPTVSASGPATGTAGSTITYTYTYNNNSGATINPSIVIYPPTNVTFTTLGDSVNCSGLNPVTCNFTNVPAAGSGSFTVTGDIAPAAAGTTLAHGEYSIAATGFPTLGGPTVFTDIPSVTTHTISGNAAGVGGVTLTYDDGGVKSTVSNADGTYTITVSDGWSGTVTPLKDLFADFFIPANQTYTNVTTDFTDQNYGAQITFNSVASYDGWVRESASNSKVGGSFSTPARRLIVGDDAQNRRFVGILSFNTTRLPDVPILVQSVVVHVKQHSLSGTNPLNERFNNLILDIKNGTIGSLSLENSDFQTPLDLKRASVFGKNPVNSWYTSSLNSLAWNYINHAGPTQMRLYVGRYFGPFYVRNSHNNQIIFYSGNNQIVNRPKLVITYLMP